jgi:hypothetical protein
MSNPNQTPFITVGEMKKFLEQFSDEAKFEFSVEYSSQRFVPWEWFSSEKRPALTLMPVGDEHE